MRSLALQTGFIHGHLLDENRDGGSRDATGGIPARFVEPDLSHRFPFERTLGELTRGSDTVGSCALEPPNSFWPVGPFGWHLANEYSQLALARNAIGQPHGKRVRVGILDTGYDPNHTTKPAHILRDLERNFTGEGDPNDATDPLTGGLGKQPGHGTATLALLAGGRVRSQDGSFDNLLGGAPEVEIVPIRIASSVIHFGSSAMAAGIRYAADIGCQVVSISMGGTPSKAWASAVNDAYEKGVAIFAAAGNRIGFSPPTHLVWPAKFRRVTGVTGFGFDRTPYYRTPPHGQMQGCFGPKEVMDQAMAAFTPNIPWAEIGCDDLVNGNGAGTSSATPQCAAAAALWLQKHHDLGLQDGWQWVEAVRLALYSTADKSSRYSKFWLGHGTLRAHDALGFDPRGQQIEITPPDRIGFFGLRSLGLFRGGSSRDGTDSHEEMCEIEAVQAFCSDPTLQQLIPDADPTVTEIDEDDALGLAHALAENSGISNKLRTYLTDKLDQR